jgi:hypothetical protein
MKSVFQRGLAASQARSFGCECGVVAHDTVDGAHAEHERGDDQLRPDRRLARADRRCCRDAAARGRAYSDLLAVHALRFELQGYRSVVCWNRRSNSDAGVLWLKDVLLRFTQADKGG